MCVDRHGCLVKILFFFYPKVHERDRFNMAAVVKLVLQISRIFSTPTERFFFIQKMEDMFSEITREFYEMSVRGKRKTIRVLGRLQISIEVYGQLYLMTWPLISIICDVFQGTSRTTGRLSRNCAFSWTPALASTPHSSFSLQHENAALETNRRSCK